MWNHPNGPSRGVDHNFKKAVAEVSTVELFSFYVIVNIIIMPTHLPMGISSNFEYISSH